MEGPSLVIASEDLSPYVDKKIKKALGNAKFEEKITLKYFNGETLVNVCSWGKHFILIFKSFSLRIHFLMFGSYRVDDPKKNRDPMGDRFFSSNIEKWRSLSSVAPFKYRGYSEVRN